MGEGEESGRGGVTQGGSACARRAARSVRLAARQAVVVPASSPLGVGLGATPPLTSRHPDFDVSLAKGIDLSCPGNPPLPSASRRGHATRSFILRRVAPCVPCGAPSPVSRPVGVGCHWPPVTDVSHGDSCPVGTAGLLVGRKKASITGGLLGGGRGGVTAVAERDGGLCFLNSRTELPEIDGNPSAKFGNNPRRLGAQAIAETVRFRRNCARFRGRGGSSENRTGAHRRAPENTGAARNAPERRGAVRSASDGTGRHRRAPATPGRESRECTGVHRRRPDRSGTPRTAPDSPGQPRKGPESPGKDRSGSAGSGQLKCVRRLMSRGAKRGPGQRAFRPPRPALRGDGSPSNSPTRTRLRPTRHGAPATGG